MTELAVHPRLSVGVSVSVFLCNELLTIPFFRLRQLLLLEVLYIGAGSIFAI